MKKKKEKKEMKKKKNWCRFGMGYCPTVLQDNGNCIAIQEIVLQ